MFSTLPKTKFNFSANLLSANAFNLDQSKNLWFGKEFPLSHMPILGSSYSAANKDNYDVKIMDKWGIQLSDSVENNMGKGEIAHYKQFLLFPQCFHKLPRVDTSK